MNNAGRDLKRYSANIIQQGNQDFTETSKWWGLEICQGSQSSISVIKKFLRFCLVMFFFNLLAASQTEDLLFRCCCLSWPRTEQRLINTIVTIAYLPISTIHDVYIRANDSTYQRYKVFNNQMMVFSPELWNQILQTIDTIKERKKAASFNTSSTLFFTSGRAIERE